MIPITQSGLLKNRTMIKQLTLFVFLLALVSCIKEPSPLPIPDIYTGTSTALKNGEEWRSLTYFVEMKSEPQRYGLRANVHNTEGHWRETFDIRRIKANMDIQEITSLDKNNQLGLLSAGYGTLIDGDVAGDIYSLDTTATNNFIQITSYNSSKAEIAGIFNVSFVLTRDSNEPGTPPQTLEFTDGKFTAKVEREWFE